MKDHRSPRQRAQDSLADRRGRYLAIAGSLRQAGPPGHDIDMTSPGHPPCLDIRTEAGIIRVSTGLSGPHGEPQVLAEIFLNTPGRPQTPAGGHWTCGTADRGGLGLDIRLTRQDEPEGRS
jgi:hypothetical protein